MDLGHAHRADKVVVGEISQLSSIHGGLAEQHLERLATASGIIGHGGLGHTIRAPEGNGRSCSFDGRQRPRGGHDLCLRNKRPSRPYESIGLGAMEVTKPY